MVGYNKNLFILPFDHRTTFFSKMFGIEDRKPTTEEIEKVKKFKEIIYEGFKKAVNKNIPVEEAAILVDEEFGANVLEKANNERITSILTMEKTGVDEFELIYGSDFEAHFKKYKPAFLKALVKYNPEGNSEVNLRQKQKLADLTMLAYKNTVRLLIEPIIPATEAQLSQVENDKNRYDREIRPRLTVQLIKEFQEAGVDPDVWKIEGMENERDYEKVVSQARFSGRDSVGVVVLGRGSDDATVETWVKAGAKVNGITGFAIGRTIFWDALTDFNSGKIDENEASNRICEKFIHFYKLFMEAHPLHSI